jgi:hypothetical protein
MLATSLLIVAGGIALGQQETAKTPRAEAKPKSGESSKAIDDFKVDAAEYVIRLASRPKDKLVLREEPLLHWGNPARTGEDGAVFVWMLDGRPEVIGSVFTYRLPKAIHRKHEYHTLAAGPLAAEYRGERVWAPTSAGVAFQPVPDAPDPAETPRLRLSQMKNLARDFSATLVDLEARRADLRLVPQPLIRYEPKDKQILDGALFSFALGTDPEVLLLLEARSSTPKDRPVWQFAFARYHYVDLKAFHKGREVWRAEPLPDITTLEIGSPKYQDNVYATYHVKVTPIAE